MPHIRINDYHNEDELEELRQAHKHERRYRLKFMNHSDCGDPDHPGCHHCLKDGMGHPRDGAMRKLKPNQQHEIQMASDDDQKLLR